MLSLHSICRECYYPAFESLHTAFAEDTLFSSKLRIAQGCSKTTRKRGAKKGVGGEVLKERGVYD
jgi:hypothetical protein